MKKRKQMKGATSALGRIQSLNAQTSQEDWLILEKIFMSRLVEALQKKEYSSPHEMAENGFAKAFEKIDTFKGGSTQKFMNWLLTIAINDRKDEFKRAQRRVDHTPMGGTEALALVRQVPAKATPATETGKTKILKLFMDPIRSEFESDHRWECFELLVIHERKSIDVAKELGKSDKAVRGYKNRMAEKVRKKYPLLMLKIQQAMALLSEYETHPDWPILDWCYIKGADEKKVGEELGLEMHELLQRRLVLRRDIEAKFPGVLENILSLTKST